MSDRLDEIRARYRRERDEILARPVPGAELVYALLVMVLVGPVAGMAAGERLPTGITGDERTMLCLLLGGVAAWLVVLAMDRSIRRSGHRERQADLERIHRNELDELKRLGEQGEGGQ